MKISTKGRYGLKAMVDLAINLDKENVTLKSISERQKISEGYLEQIFSVLRKNGIVKGIKGQGGGYVICKGITEVTVGYILRALEGDLSVVDTEENQDKMDECLSKTVWYKINSSISGVVDNITLQDLVEEYNRDKEGYMFYI